MKNKDVVTRDVLKMVIDKARSIKKEQYPNDTSEHISDDMIIQAINKEIKQLAQTLDSIKGKTEDKFVEIAQVTNDKIAILSAYLPSQMTREEVEQAVYTILSNRDFPNFGMKMKAVMSELKGKADNKIIKEVVETYK
ncbi:MAG: GatB/YqeY domain-containing protein [Bacteroidales bacterium]|nr:GatB/YqeY domain-containing protein [Bacteroidales bacterium]